MKAAIAQITPRLGNLEANVETHLNFIEKARQDGADLVVFPELSLTGYLLKDMVEEIAIDPASSSVMKKILSRTKGISAVLGFVEENEAEKGIFYNSAAFLADGKILHVHRKVYLPTNGMFEEAKFFAPGRRFSQFQSSFGRIGLLICRDFLHFGASYIHFAGGADIIIVISSAPGRGIGRPKRFETARMWELMGEAVSYFSTCFVIYANRTGIEDGMTFAGGSFFYAPGGRMLSRAADVEPEFMVQEIDLEAVREARRNWVFKRDEKPEVIIRSLERIVRDSASD